MNVKVFEFEIQTKWKNRLKYNLWVIANYVVTFCFFMDFLQNVLYSNVTNAL